MICRLVMRGCGDSLKSKANDFSIKFIKTSTYIVYSVQRKESLLLD